MVLGSWGAFPPLEVQGEAGGQVGAYMHDVQQGSGVSHEPPSLPPSSPPLLHTCLISSRFCASCRQQQWSQKNLSSLSSISVALGREWETKSMPRTA